MNENTGKLAGGLAGINPMRSGSTVAQTSPTARGRALIPSSRTLALTRARNDLQLGLASPPP